MRTKRLRFAAVFMALVLLLGGCASGGARDGEAMYPAEAPAVEEAMDQAAAGSGDSGMNYMADDDMGQTGDTGAAIPPDRKIIQNAWLEIEADDARGFYAGLSEYCKELGGYEFSNSISNSESYSVVTAVLKVPPQKLDKLMEYAGEGARIVNSGLSSDDITDSYYDAETRLTSKRNALERYYRILENAKTIEEIIYIQQAIDKLTEEIEALEGRLGMWSKLVSMATVEITVRQENDPVKIQKEISWNTLSASDMGYLIKRGLVSIADFFVSVFQWAAVVLAIISPLLLIAAIVLFIVWRVRKKQGRPLFTRRRRIAAYGSRKEAEREDGGGDRRQ